MKLNDTWRSILTIAKYILTYLLGGGTAYALM